MPVQRPPFPGRHPGFGTGAELWLLRHGEVREDWQGKAYGALDVPLSERGASDTLAAARAFAPCRFTAVISSSLQRSRVLGELLARDAGVELAVEPALAEIQRGRWQGLPVEELLARHEREVEGFYADPWGYDLHGGETDAHVLARAWPVVERAVKEHGRSGPAPARIAFAVHYNVIRAIAARALGIDPARSFRLRVDPSAAVLLIDAPGGFVLARSNVKGPAEGSAR